MAATEIMWRNGYDATSMSEIARAVGLGKGALYHYVASKEQLLYLIVKDVYDAAYDEVDAIADSDAPPLERLAAFVEEHVRFAARRKFAYLLCVRDLRFLPERLQDDVTRGGQTSRGTLRRILLACRQDGVVDESVDLDLQTTMVLSGLLYAIRWQRDAKDVSVDRMARLQVRLVVAGLATSRAGACPIDAARMRA